jgi:hypothetical protein
VKTRMREFSPAGERLEVAGSSRAEQVTAIEPGNSRTNLYCNQPTACYRPVPPPRLEESGTGCLTRSLRRGAASPSISRGDSSARIDSVYTQSPSYL